jgi:hypothetical protein
MPAPVVFGPKTLLEQLRADLKSVRRALRAAGVPKGILGGAERRARLTGRKTTGAAAANRAPRWTLEVTDRNWATRETCLIIELRLLAMLLSFKNAPVVPPATRSILERWWASPIVAGTFRDALLLEVLDYAEFAAEAAAATSGVSKFHIGHTDPTIPQMHTAENTAWRTHRSNLIQGNMTLRQARVEFLRIMGRYFEIDLLIED